VKRQSDRSFVIADTYNDRILEISESGALISGVGSVNYQVTNSLFPLAACVDIRTGILYVVWSEPVSFKNVNMSKMIIQTSTQTAQLIRNFDKILGLTMAELETVNATGQIMAVTLSPQNAGLVQQFSATETFLQVSGDTEDGVVPGGIDITSQFYTVLRTGLGIPCFVGNFAYIDGIFTPTWADKTLSNGFVIGNGTIAVKDYNFPSDVTDSITKSANVSSIIEIDEDNNVVFGSNIMNFSPFFPGRVQELDSSTFLIGGIRPGGQDGAQGSTLNFRSFFGDNANKTTQKSILSDIFFGASNVADRHFGSVLVYDRTVNSTIFQYTSPEGVLVSDVDVDALGQYVIAESSFSRSGRVIKLDTSGNLVFSVGDGLYSLINDVAVQVDGSIVIST
jgi:hypothetical protein